MIRNARAAPILNRWRIAARFLVMLWRLHT
jgi:hypothetical protein